MITQSATTPISTSAYAILAATSYNRNRGRQNQMGLPPDWIELGEWPADTSHSIIGSRFSGQAYKQKGTDNIVIAFDETDFNTATGAGKIFCRLFSIGYLMEH